VLCLSKNIFFRGFYPISERDFLTQKNYFLQHRIQQNDHSAHDQLTSSSTNEHDLIRGAVIEQVSTVYHISFDIHSDGNWIAKFES
jgi:hypothetical protein